MEYKTIGSTDIKASDLAIGAFGMGGGSAWGQCDDGESITLLQRARDLGVNLIDSAPVYGAGHSEEIIGKAIKGCRSDYVLQTKCTLHWRDTRGVKEYERDGNTVYRCFDSDSLRKDLEDSLKRMGTDYIDIYMTHRQPEDYAQVEEIYKTMADFKKEGKIRAIALSNAGPDLLKEYLKYGPVDLVQEQYSILEPGFLSDYIPFCEEKSITFQCYSALARGLLTGKIGMDYELKAGETRNSIRWFAKEQRQLVLDMLSGWDPLCKKYDCSVSSLVLAYTMQTSKTFNTLVGVRRMENLEDSVKAASLQLDSVDIATMNTDAKKAQELSGFTAPPKL